jgi:hypothetical protein
MEDTLEDATRDREASLYIYRLVEQGWSLNGYFHWLKANKAR